MKHLTLYNQALTIKESLDSFYYDLMELGDPKELGTYFLLEKIRTTMEEANWVASNSKDILNEKQ